MKTMSSKLSKIIGVFALICLASSIALAWSADSFKKPSDGELKKKLTAIQYQVTQHEGTETPFKNEFHNNKADGIYVDIVSGEPLFSSKDKFDSGTGWPSFFQVIKKDYIVEKKDNSLFSSRTEIRSKIANSHIGHVFDDGPKPTGLRYCMNSAAMRFIPAADLEKEGYSEFKPLFGAVALAGKPGSEFIVLAGGCFWCMESPFEKLDGVTEVISGYSGGDKKTATYEQVSNGGTGHFESVKVVYNPNKITLAELLKVYWHQVDPLDSEGQFCDKGSQYKSAIFYKNDTEKKLADESLAEIMKTPALKGSKIFTQIRAGTEFYAAEDYHQDYYKKNPIRYKFYRGNCKRDERLEKIWGQSSTH